MSLDVSLSASKSSIECPPITFVFPVFVTPPEDSRKTCLSAWTSLCLVALAGEESDASPPYLLSKSSYQEWCATPCQTVKIPRSKRGTSAPSLSVVQGRPHFFTAFWSMLFYLMHNAYFIPVLFSKRLGGLSRTMFVPNFSNVSRLVLRMVFLHLLVYWVRRP